MAFRVEGGPTTKWIAFPQSKRFIHNSVYAAYLMYTGCLACIGAVEYFLVGDMAVCCCAYPNTLSYGIQRAPYLRNDGTPGCCAVVHATMPTAPSSVLSIGCVVLSCSTRSAIPARWAAQKSRLCSSMSPPSSAWLQQPRIRPGAPFLFLYRSILEISVDVPVSVLTARTPRHLPAVFTCAEVQAVLAHMHGPHLRMAQVRYGSGVRLLEGLRLRVKDLDVARRQLTAHDGKGEQDRVTMVPLALSNPPPGPSGASCPGACE